MMLKADILTDVINYLSNPVFFSILLPHPKNSVTNFLSNHPYTAIFRTRAECA